MRKLNLIQVLGILILCLLSAFALAERPSRKPTAPSPSRINSREHGTFSRAHLPSPQSRATRPSPVAQNWRSPMPVSVTKPSPVKNADSRFIPPARIEKSTISSRISREDREHSGNDRHQPEFHDRRHDGDNHHRDRDHDHRPPQRDYSHHHQHRTHYDPWRYRYDPWHYHRPYYSHRYYRQPSYGFSISLGSDWDFSCYDSFYSNYCDSGLSFGLSYGSDDYGIYVSSGSPAYVSSYQVWVPGHWETVTDRVTEVGFGGVVSWRYKNHQVWSPGYWKVCYR
ncbi:hypothetical protein JW926_16900 [Candidatus Sumerlaeota bacterium]|nr:hypothetical protein [Candidatus Sumerlaeota bacterium]